MPYLLTWFMGMCVMKIQSRELNLIHVSSSQKRPYMWPSFCECASLNLCSIKAHVLKMLGDTFERHFGVSGVGHHFRIISSVQFSSVDQSCPTLCDPMNRSMPGLPVHHQLPEFTQTHIHRVSDAIQPSHPLLSPFPPASKPSQHQSLFQWVSSSHEVAKVLEFQL